MRRARIAAATAICCAALVACGESQAPAMQTPSPAAEASAPAPAPPPAYAIGGRIHADLPPMTFTPVVEGAPGPDGVLHVRAIEIQRAGEARPLQRIDGLATETPWSPPSPALELVDMNFDGYADLRLVEGRPAGPNVPYLNWLYDPASGRFVGSPALDGIGSPSFDAAARVIRSAWRDGPARYGTDVYVIQDGQPVPSRREVKRYTQPGAYTLEVSAWVDGTWKPVETRPGRDP